MSVSTGAVLNPGLIFIKQKQKHKQKQKQTIQYTQKEDG
jgi:hypothetical protein|tara:strand:+ start:343 stop:459 length:117 start_codon:yes stop_codon:yes gene_type:complete